MKSEIRERKSETSKNWYGTVGKKLVIGVEI